MSDSSSTTSASSPGGPSSDDQQQQVKQAQQHEQLCAYVANDPVPARMSAEQVRCIFPGGIRGLRSASSGMLVFPSENGSLILEPNAYYTLVTSNNNGNNNDNSGVSSCRPPVSPSPSHQYSNSASGMTSASMTQQQHFFRSQQNQQNNNHQHNFQHVAVSPGRRQACQDDSDEEVGVIISPSRTASALPPHHGNMTGRHNSRSGSLPLSQQQLGGGSSQQDDGHHFGGGGSQQQQQQQWSQQQSLSQGSNNNNNNNMMMMMGGAVVEDPNSAHNSNMQAPLASSYSSASPCFTSGLAGGGAASSSSQVVVRRGKLIMDRVHDHIMMPPLICRIVDTPDFQRLRYLKQLGPCAYLYPGATHTRFEHSIGVSHLAGLMAKKIARRQPELGITEMDVLCVMAAGLCHDLGHGPFSHLFETVVNASLERQGKRRRWHHEEMSDRLVRRVFQALFEQNDETVRDMAPEDVNFICLAINGMRPGQPWPNDVGRPDTMRCLLDIVANKRNGIDVDKLDYFMRDSLACYGKAAIDIHITRLINSCRAIRFEGEMQICFEEKMGMSLGDIFSVRAKLHKYAYQHRTTKVVDNMIRDALRLAEPHFLVRGSQGRMMTLVEAIDDPEAFIGLGDWILNAIASTNDPQLQEARDVIHRLHTRQLYSLVGGAQLRFEKLSKEQIRGQIMENYVTPHDADALDRNLIVEMVRITYGSSDSSGTPDDPVNHVTFYNPKGDCDHAFRLAHDRRNPLFSPMAYSETTVLVLCRDRGCHDVAIEAFEQWKKAYERFLEPSIPVFNSPRRQREHMPSQALLGGREGSASVGTSAGPTPLPPPAPGY